MSKTLNTTLTRAAFVKIVTGDKRTETNVVKASGYVRGEMETARFDRALWLHVRVAVDAAPTETVAAEAGVTSGRISQVRAGVVAMADAGIDLATIAGDAGALYSQAYAVLSTAYKSGKVGRENIRNAVEKAAAVSDVATKMSILGAVQPGEKAKRAPRPASEKGTTETDKTGTPVVGGTEPTERPSTIAETMANVVARVKSGEPIADVDALYKEIDALHDALAARTGVVAEEPAAA
jgi:hypothetical protein